MYKRQYREGARWAVALYAEGGWEALNRAYARLPCSTEQILHPQKYLDGEPPQPLALPDLGAALGEGWERLRHDTLGEWLLGLHLSAHLEDATTAWEAAAGWAGDTFEIWESEEGELLLVWRVAWDDRDEAAEFERAYGLLVPRFRTPPLVAVDNPYRLPGRLWDGAAGAAYVGRTGRVVTVVWGPDLEMVVEVAEALP